MGIQQMLVGASAGPSIKLSAYAAYSSGVACELMFNTNGSISYTENGVVTTLLSEWLNPNPNSGQAALYEVQRTQVSGGLGVSFTGTFTSGTWYPLTAQRGVFVITNGTVLRQNTSTYAIRRASDGVVLVTGITISVTSDFL